MTTDHNEDEFLGLLLQERQRLSAINDKAVKRIEAIDALIEAYSDEESEEAEITSDKSLDTMKKELAEAPSFENPAPVHNTRRKLEGALADQPTGRFEQHEIDTICTMKKAGRSIKEIAAKLGREYASVYSKAKSLGF